MLRSFLFILLIAGSGMAQASDFGASDWDLETSREFQAMQAREASQIPAELPSPMGRFRNTFYYLILESEYTQGEKTEEILDRQDKVLVRVTPQFRKDLLMEGSGRLADGRVLNYAGQIDGIYRFEFTSHSWGRGVGNCALKPFKTLAVDPSRIPFGSMVYVDETVGMELPDGSRHNGIWYAHDTGSAIRQDRIDIFVGQKAEGRRLARKGISHLQGLTIRMIAPPNGEICSKLTPQLAP